MQHKYLKFSPLVETVNMFLQKNCDVSKNVGVLLDVRIFKIWNFWNLIKQFLLCNRQMLLYKKIEYNVLFLELKFHENHLSGFFL